MSKISFLFIKEDKTAQYTKTNLISTFQLMGCKPKNSIDMAKIIFSWISVEVEKIKDFDDIQVNLSKEEFKYLQVKECTTLKHITKQLTLILKKYIEYKNQNIAIVPRELFLEMVKVVLNIHEYCHKDNNQAKIDEFIISCQVHERKIPLIILFGGTSGCGKSTLAALIASRIGITQVLSTDSVRHMLRTVIDEKSNPVVFSSTYHAYEGIKDTNLQGEDLVIEGYQRQCKAVTDYLDNFILKCIKRKDSLVLEGVHLTSDYIVSLMKRFDNILPFFIFISNEAKHRERFAVRAKYMTLDKYNNKYIEYFENIRVIQKWNQESSNLYQLPTIDNTSIDRSIATIQDSIFHSLKHLYLNQKLFDKENNKSMIKLRTTKPYAWSSKSMLKVIKTRKSFNKLTDEVSPGKSSEKVDIKKLISEEMNQIMKEEETKEEIKDSQKEKEDEEDASNSDASLLEFS